MSRRPAPSFRPNLKLSEPYQYGRPWLEGREWDAGLMVGFALGVMLVIIAAIAVLIVQWWPR